MINKEGHKAIHQSSTGHSRHDMHSAVRMTMVHTFQELRGRAVELRVNAAFRAYIKEQNTYAVANAWMRAYVYVINCNHICDNDVPRDENHSMYCRCKCMQLQHTHTHVLRVYTYVYRWEALIIVALGCIFPHQLSFSELQKAISIPLHFKGDLAGTHTRANNNHQDRMTMPP